MVSSWQLPIYKLTTPFCIHTDFKKSILLQSTLRNDVVKSRETDGITTKKSINLKQSKLIIVHSG